MTPNSKCVGPYRGGFPGPAQRSESGLPGRGSDMGRLRELKCLFVIDSLGSGGAQRQMVTLAQILQGRGHSIELFTYHSQHQHLLSEVQGRGISLVSVTKRARYSPGVVLSLRRLLRRNCYDVILAYLDAPSLYAELANATVKRIPLVVSERSTYPPGRMPLRTRVLQEAHRLADAIVVNSHHQRRRMVRRFPWMGMKLRTITNGVDLERFCPAAVRTVAEVSREGSLELLAVGNIVQNKNVCGLIEALIVLRRTHRINVRVRWAGKRLQTVAGQQLFARAQRMLTENALTGSWEWLGERVDMPELLRSHDALIHPSFYEGMSNAICEALACGRPVLASDVCDHRNLVQDGRTGFLFDPKSPADMAAAIHRFACLSPSARGRAGLLARQYAEAALGQDDFADAYEGLFNELCACNSK